MYNIIRKIFCVGVVFYNPKKVYIDNISNYYNLVDKIYIFDNTETNGDEVLRALLDMDSMNKCKYIKSSSNIGISGALNFICEIALREGYKYIMTLDQDSVIFPSSLETMLNCIQKLNDPNVGLYAPSIRYVKEYKEIPGCNKGQMTTCGKITEIKWAITSGSVLDLNIFRKIGGFDENLFVDRVDYDYCLTLRKYGYKIVRIEDVIVYHFLGESKGRIFRLSQHQPIRHYYMFRNRLYIVGKHNKVYKGLKKYIFIIFASLKHLFLILILESSKLEKIKMIMKAIKDYKNGKMGKIN